MGSTQTSLKTRKGVELEDQSSFERGLLTAKIPPKALHCAVVSEGLNRIKNYWWKSNVGLNDNLVSLHSENHTIEDMEEAMNKLTKMPQVHLWKHFQSLYLCARRDIFFIWSFLNTTAILRPAYVNSLRHLSIKFPEWAQIYGQEYEGIARIITRNCTNLQSLSLDFYQCEIMAGPEGLANMVYILAKHLTPRLERFKLCLRQMNMNRKFVEEIGFHITKYLVNVKCLELYLSGQNKGIITSEDLLSEQFSNICNKLVSLEKLSLRFELLNTPSSSNGDVVSHIIKNNINLRHLELYIGKTWVEKPIPIKYDMLLELMSQICSQFTSLEKLEIRLIGFYQIDDKFLKSLVSLLSTGPPSLKDVTLGFAHFEKISSSGIKTFGNEVSKKLNKFNSLCLGLDHCPNIFPNDLKTFKKKLEKDIKNFTLMPKVELWKSY